ncbi:related to Copper transport protein CTR2 [Saccharomycodes ludwigii]|uniref:Copper transport protein n=1 Tax=Saccharomycodes ludwigii TaxID=36035 RepID=A0A376B1J0_9ASCO|nr:hypothetical protein SCDLUD_004755 [Saccharomycodes ludwigii]KAH3899316.1 hypothetical protein SCDLUD_004755 [Saccharomycodes ludwigii]SSD58511.1 related to Copper transport protein CTR2 [Saccharomycodes ludwigii]
MNHNNMKHHLLATTATIVTSTTKKPDSMHSMPPDGSHNTHGDMGKCSMSMTFTWNYTNTCVIFKWWRIKNFFELILSCLLIIIIAQFYEYLKYKVTRYRKSFLTIKLNSTPENSKQYQKFKIRESLYYSVQVGYSFMLMLVFMTYNGWLMLSVVIGAFLGHYHWNCPGSNGLPNTNPNACAQEEDLEGMACH